MDPEQTFLNVHMSLCGMLSQWISPRIMTALEYLCLIGAIALFCLMVVMHTNFVGQPGCSSELSAVEISDADLVQIKITSSGLWAHVAAQMDTPKQGIQTGFIQIPDVDGEGLPFLAAKFWLNWIGSCARRVKLLFKLWKGDTEFVERKKGAVDSGGSELVTDATEGRALAETPYKSVPVSAEESFKAAVANFWGKWCMQLSSLWQNAKLFLKNAAQLQRIEAREMLLVIPKWAHNFRVERIGLFIVQWFEERSKAFEPTYLYTVEKGYRMLSEGAKSKHKVSAINVSISAQHSCFGNRWQRLLIRSFVGYDTILVNSLLNASASGQGYFFNLQTNESYDLHYAHKSAKNSSRPLTEKAEELVAKCGVVMVSLFVFLTTTMSVSFTFRETQSRMLKFTVQLQHHARHQLPTFQLIFVHVIRSLVFVPIMIGTLFFLFECYDDQLLAIMVLILVWQGVVFTIISARTPLSMQYFPRFFLLYFLMFHIYFFSYTYGFSYLAFSTTAAFMQHLVLYFWNRFEVPAFQRFTRHQFQLQQQAGVHITSSTILTSTLHIARVNMRNPNFFNELGPTPGPGPGLDQARANPVGGAEITGANESSSTNNPNVMGSPRPLPESNPQHPENAPNSSSPNSVSSLLLWILGGGSGDALVSFLLSRFRDMRDQGQESEESSRHETHRPLQNS